MKSLSAFPALLLAVAVLAGCSNESNPVADLGGSDPAQTYASSAGVESAANAMPAEEFEIDTYADGEVAKEDIGDASFAAAIGVSGALQAEIDPAFWFRLIRSHERRYVVEITNPDSVTRVAHVRIVDRLLGIFNVITAPDSLDSLVVRGEWIRKRLADRSVRKAVFVRHKIVRDGEDEDEDGDRLDDEDGEDGLRDGWSRWFLRAVSGAEISSDEGTRTITSLRLVAGDVDVTVTDPLELKRRRDILRLPASTPVHVTVTTGDPRDVVVLYARWGRSRLRRMDDGTFQGRFLSPAGGGLRHVAVNALSRGTLFDDVAPYDSKAWALPFVVEAAERTAAN
jgi:hypothetical protein